MTSAAVRLGADGRLEVVRHAPPEDAVRLARTVERLQRAAGTGVVDLVGVTSTDDGELTVVLAHAGAAIGGPLPPAEVARLGASLAATLADLHGRGIVHGAVRAEHVLRDAVGTVRLCGMGHGDAEPGDDVAALGALLRELLDDRDTTDAARDVRVVLDRCAVDEPHARPTASAVAAALAAAAPAPRTIERPAASRPRTRDASRSWRHAARTVITPHKHRDAVVMVAAVVAAIIAGRALTRGPAPARAAASTRDATIEASRPSHRSSTTRPSTSVAAVGGRVWPPSPPNVLHADGTWTFGTADDHVVLGDWDCDGVDTPALVQPDGDVYVVDAWADGTAARRVTRVAGAIATRVEASGTCDRLVVETDDGGAIRPSMDGS